MQEPSLLDYRRATDQGLPLSAYLSPAVVRYLALGIAFEFL